MKIIFSFGLAIFLLTAADARLVAQQRTDTDATAFRKALQAKLTAGKTDAATAYFKETIKAVKTAPAKKRVRLEYLRGMARAGKPVEAYRAFPGGTDSFRILAEQLVASGQAAPLQELVREHEVFFDDDPHVNLYRGQLAFEAKKYAEADAAWNLAFQSIGDEAFVEQFHRRRVRARYGMGKMLSALNDLPATPKTFGVLADLCLENKKFDDLDQLIAAFVKRERLGYSKAMEYFMQLHREKSPTELLRLARMHLGTGLNDATIDRQVYLHLARAGRVIDCYIAANDKTAAFAALQSALRYGGDFATRQGLIDAHRKAEPDDPAADPAEADLLLDMNQPDKALVILKALEKNAKRSILTRSKYLEASRLLGKGIDAYKEGGLAESDFTTLARQFSAEHNVAALEELLKIRPRGNAAREKNLWKYQAKIKILTGKPEEALELYLESGKAAKVAKAAPLKGKNPKGKGGFGGFGGFGGGANLDSITQRMDEREFLDDMVQTGHGLAVYRVAPVETFATLAAYYRSTKNKTGLEKLLSEHRVNSPDDPSLPFYTAVLELLRGNGEAAENILRVELTMPAPKKAKEIGFGGGFGAPDEVDTLAPVLAVNRRVLLDGLTHALILQGRTVEQYRLAGSDTEAFLSLAHLCILEHAAAELQALVAAHRKTHPNDPALRSPEAEAAFLKGDYETAWKVFKDAVELEGERAKALVCLVRLKRFDDAAKFALKWEAERRVVDPTPLILAHAAAGDVKQTLRLLEIHARRHGNLEKFYGDADLGPLLRSDALAKVRARFPERGKK